MDEFASLTLDKTTARDLKSDEQIRKHSIEDNLEDKPIERALYILTVGEEVQRLSVVNSLPVLLRGPDAPLCMQRIVPKILLALDKASKEFHVAAALTFYTILEKKLVHPKTYAETFLRSMVEHIDFKVPEVASIWLDVLLDAIALLPNDSLRAEVLPVAIAKAQISQPVSSRVKACRLLGKASLYLDSFYLKKEILPVILSLCQDVNHEVRACICTELSNIIKPLDTEVTKTTLLPALVELASDEEALVRISAVSTIVEVLGYLTPDTIKNTIIPLVKKLCNQAKTAEDDVLVSISFQIGKLCLGLQNYMSPNEKQWILIFYQEMAQLGTVAKDTTKKLPMPDFNMTGNADRLILCRQNCAYNFPAMTMFCTNLGGHYYDQLYTTFCALAGDPYFMVRRTIACGFHEVASVLGANCGKVKRELIKLLRDDVEEVLQGLIPNLSKSLETLAKYRELGPDQTDVQSLDVGRAILKCEAEINETHNWRLHSMLMCQIECLPLCLPSDFLHNYFIPIIFTRVHKSRAVPCRIAAARTLLVFLRYNPKAPQRNDLRTRIINEFCRGKSCFARIAFTKLCGAAMDIFSRHYFKEQFFLQLLELTDDKVPNVRLQVVGYFPRMKTMLQLPQDKKLLTALEASVRKMATAETDRDVKALLNASMEKLDRTVVRDETAGPGVMTKEDIEDLRKVEEENKLASAKPDVAKKKQDAAPPKVVAQPVAGGSFKKTSVVGYGNTQVRPHPSPPTGRGRISGGPPPPPVRAAAMASLEDEFYVDAGIRIPQQLAAAGDLAAFPTRIPNLREILFRNRNINSIDDGSNSNCIGSTMETPKVNSSILTEPQEESQMLMLTSTSLPSPLSLPPRVSLSPLALVGSSSSPPLSSPPSLFVSSQPTLSTTMLSSQSVNSSNPVTLKLALSESKVKSKQNVPSGVMENSGKIKTDQNVTSLKVSVLNRATKHNNDACFAAKIENSCSGSSKEKSGTIERKQREINTVVGRRHSYMDGEKHQTSNIVNKADSKSSGIEKNYGNRRHSYIEKVSLEEGKTKSLYVVKRNYVGTTNAMRNSYMGMEQGTCSTKPKIDVTLRKSGIPSRRSYCENNSVAPKRRSFAYVAQQFNNRENPLEKKSNFGKNIKDYDMHNSQISKHPNSAAVQSKRRHSYLEGDDLEKLRIPYDKVQINDTRSFRTSLECISYQNPVNFEKDVKDEYVAHQNNIDESENLVLNDKKKQGEKLEFQSCDENLALMIKKRNRLSLSKIPRGSASCHSSPGGSRASSPTGCVGNGLRTRQRTAPNSRSTSPTGALNYSGNIRRTQRLSLGSLNSYMSNLKLNESSSRLPIRKPPP